MKIAQIAPIIERVPPKKYGGTERVVHALTEELVRRGHDVTLFASGDSITSATLVSVAPVALREVKAKEIYGNNILSLLNIGTAYGMEKNFDIIHDHNGYLSLPVANMATTPVVTTMHGPITPEVRKIFSRLSKPSIVSISKAQMAPAPNLNYAGTVYNGLEMDTYPFSAENEGYLLYVGRISMEKGTHIAIEVAQELNLPLVIAAKLDRVDEPYYREYVKESLSEKIRWIGEVDEAERNKLYSKALAFLHPITWREPFGLTLVEAMACGAPVIAFGLGSIPELVVHGKTGFVVHDLEGMIDAVGQIDRIDRAQCREHSLANFSAARMADGYEKVYASLLEKNENK